MRPLTLHASALNDDEYAHFTSSLAELVAPDPAPTEHEKPLISTREVRAWLRGRYAELPLSELDAVRTCSYPVSLLGSLNCLYRSCNSLHHLQARKLCSALDNSLLYSGS